MSIVQTLLSSVGGFVLCRPMEGLLHISVGSSALASALSGELQKCAVHTSRCRYVLIVYAVTGRVSTKVSSIVLEKVCCHVHQYPRQG